MSVGSEVPDDYFPIAVENATAANGEPSLMRDAAPSAALLHGTEETVPSSTNTPSRNLAGSDSVHSSEFNDVPPSVPRAASEFAVRELHQQVVAAQTEDGLNWPSWLTESYESITGAIPVHAAFGAGFLNRLHFRGLGMSWPLLNGSSVQLTASSLSDSLVSVTNSFREDFVDLVLALSICAVVLLTFALRVRFQKYSVALENLRTEVP